MQEEQPRFNKPVREFGEGSSSVEDDARVAISLTAHERIDVLFDQVKNIRFYCRNPLIVIHINSVYFDQICESPEELHFLGLISIEKGVIINSEHIDTRWAHMFHAHISNIGLLVRTGAVYAHLLLLSSADLFFRAGIENYLVNLDASMGTTAPFSWTNLPMPLAGWNIHIAKDLVFKKILDKLGIDLIYKDAHEGSFYRRPIVENMWRTLTDSISDWDYDNKYPKEEYFFPTLVRKFSGVRFSHRVSHILAAFSNAERDRLATALILNELTLSMTEKSLLQTWIDSVKANSAADTGLLADRFVLSRIPRNPAHPMRLLLCCIGLSGRRDAAKAIARRLSAIDILRLERSGSRAEIHRVESIDASEVIVELFRMKQYDIFSSSDLIELPDAVHHFSRSAGFAPARPAWSAGTERSLVIFDIQLCAAYLMTEDAMVELRPTADGLVIEGRMSNFDSEQIPFFFLFLPVNVLLSKRLEAFVFTFPADQEGIPSNVWIEQHWPGGKRGFSLGASMNIGLRDDKRYLIYLIPDELHSHISDRPQSAIYLYIASNFNEKSLIIQHIAVI